MNNLLFKRVLARVYDNAALTALVFSVTILIGLEQNIAVTRGGFWSVAIVSYAIVIPLLWKGFTVGKRINQVRIGFAEKNLNGKKKFSRMFLREFVGIYLIGLFTFGIALIVSVVMMAVREDGKGIHDFIGNTYVDRIA